MIMMVHRLIREEGDGRTTWPGTLACCQFDFPHDSLLFLSYSGTLQDAVKHGAKYRVRDIGGYFVGWHNREFLMISPEAWSALYVRVPERWKKYDLCLVFLVPTISLLSYALNVFFNNLSCARKLYRTVACDHCVMVVMDILQLVHPTDEKEKMGYFGFESWPRENFYNEVLLVLFMLKDTVVIFALEVELKNIFARSNYSAVFAHRAVLRLAEVDCNQLKCFGWYRHEYWTAYVREVLATHRGGGNYTESKPRAREYVDVVNVVDVKSMFGEKGILELEKFVQILASPGGYGF